MSSKGNTRAIILGTPGTLTGSTSNAVTTSSHTHSITTVGTGAIIAETNPIFNADITINSSGDRVFFDDTASGASALSQAFPGILIQMQSF